jgi:hypothetical protein
MTRHNNQSGFSIGGSHSTNCFASLILLTVLSPYGISNNAFHTFVGIQFLRIQLKTKTLSFSIRIDIPVKQGNCSEVPWN